MGIIKKIMNVFSRDDDKKKPAGGTPQASASGGKIVVGKTIVNKPAAPKEEPKKKQPAATTKKQSTQKKNQTASKPKEHVVAAGKTPVVVRPQEQPKKPSALEQFNAANKERYEREQAEKRAARNRENQLTMLDSAARTLETNLTALKGKYERAPEAFTAEDAETYNHLWEKYQDTVGNYNTAVQELQAEQAAKQAKKDAENRIIQQSLNSSPFADMPTPAQTTAFDIDPQAYKKAADQTAEAVRIRSDRFKEQAPKSAAGIFTAGVAAAQDTVARANLLAEQAAWAMSPMDHDDPALRREHERQVQAWKDEIKTGKEYMEDAFDLTADSELGQFLAKMNYAFVQQGASMVAGGAIGKAGGTVLNTLGKQAAGAGANAAGKIGSIAAQRAGTAAQLSGKTLQGAAIYLERNAGLGTLATLAGSANYQEAIENGANNGQAMAYGILTAAAEAATEKLFGGNPMMDTGAGVVNKALYKMLGDRKFLKALDSIPVEIFAEGFEEVIANYLYAGAQKLTGQEVRMPTAAENAESFALGAALGGAAHGARLAGQAVERFANDGQIGGQLRSMGATEELMRAGEMMKNTGAADYADALRSRGTLPTAREVGKLYRKNIEAQRLLTARQEAEINSAKQLAQQVGARVVVDPTLRGGTANGYQLNGEIHIAEDAKNPFMVVFKHELTHHLQQAAPQEYEQFRSAAVELAGEDAVQHIMELYAKQGHPLSYEEAQDEVAANFTEKLLTDQNAVEGLIQKDPTLADRFFEALRQFIARLTSRGESVDPKIRQAEQLWKNAYQAAESKKNTAFYGGDKKYSFEGKEGVVPDGFSRPQLPSQNSESDVNTNDVLTDDKTYLTGDNRRYTINEISTEHDENTLGNTSAKLTEDEIAAILSYKSSESYKINVKLRNGVPLTEAEEKLIDALDRALAKLPKVKGAVYRTLSFDSVSNPDKEFNSFLDKHVAGGFVYYNSYTSASTDVDGYPITDDTKYAAFLKINSSSARNLEGFGNNFESEVLFKRETDFIVMDVYIDENGYAHITIEEVNKNANGEQSEYDTEKRSRAVRELQKPHSVYSDLQSISERDTDRNQVWEGGVQKLQEEIKYSLKEPAADLKAMRKERKEVRDQIGNLEWLQERNGGLSAEDAAELSGLRDQEKQLTQDIEQAMKEEKKNQRPEAERIRNDAEREATAVKPKEAEKSLRTALLDTFHVQAGNRKALGQQIDSVAEQILDRGYATATDEADLYRALYQAGVIVDTSASESYEGIRKDLRGSRIYVDETTRAEIGDDYAAIKKQAFANGMYLTQSKDGAQGIDQLYADLIADYPGMFDYQNTDHKEMLESMISAAEMGKSEHISLMEAAMRTGGEDAVEAQMAFFEKYLTQELEKFSDKAGFEMRIKADSIRNNAKMKALAVEAQTRASEQKALREAHNRTLKTFQRLRKMRKTESAEMQKAIDDLVGGFDTLAKSMNADTEATYKNLRDIYEQKRHDDPNFLPDKDLEARFERLDQMHIGEMTREDAVELYRAGTQLIHDIQTAHKEIAEKNARELADIYQKSAEEIRNSEGDLREYDKNADFSIEKARGFKRRYWNEEQLSPMNYIEKMGGWLSDGTFYSMAKQLERGEFDKQRYIVDADKILEKFTKEHKDWIATADGKGKDSIWYEYEVPAIFVRGHGADRVEKMETVKIHMTPMMKVKLYLDSACFDNLRHIRYGGITFPNRALYVAGNTKAAYAQGTTVKLNPEIVKNLVNDLTPEERQLAAILGGQYFNGMAKKEINRVSNLLVGYDKAMADNYSPIFTNKNFLAGSADPAIMDATIEGGGMLKNRIWSGNPSLAVSVLDAYEKHRDFTAKYVGLAIPVRNMNAVLNYTESSYNDSMRDIISKKWGSEAVKYLDDLLVNLQNKPTAETTILDDAINKVLNNYVTAIFGLNPGTVVKQAPGFYMAGARLGFDTMPKTSLFKSALRKYRETINTYTPLLEWRARGYSTRELAELRNNPKWDKKNEATRFLFGGAIQWMDLHTCAAIWPWAENYVRKHYPDLKAGSAESIQAGTDPFYKKVAEVFEDAIVNSQPMYDDMHTAQILHNNKSLARGITMFHTAQLTQANTVRKAHGELRRAEKEYKHTQDDKWAKEIWKGRRALANSVTALLVATLGFEAMGMLVNAFKRNRQMRDEDGEYTLKSVSAYLSDAMAKDLLGNIVGADALYEVFMAGGAALINASGKNAKWYGFETPGLDIIVDTISDSIQTLTALGKFSGGISGIDSHGDLTFYMKTEGTDLYKNMKRLAMDVCYILGVPAKNAETYLLGLFGWANPEAAAAYKSKFGEYGRNRITELNSRPREQKAAIEDLLQKEIGDLDEETIGEIVRLFPTAGVGVLPSDAPDAVHRKINEDESEEVRLLAPDKVKYRKKYSEVLTDSIGELMASDAYHQFDDEQKAGAIRLLYQYAAEQAAAAAVSGVTLTGWRAGAADAVKAGATIEDAVIYKVATGDIESELDAEGNKISGSIGKQQRKWLQDSDMTETEQAAIYFNMQSDADRKKLEELQTDGVGQTDYYRFIVKTRDMEADKDADGESVSGSLTQKLYTELSGMDIPEDQKAAIYRVEISDYTESNGYEPAHAAGVTDWQFATFKAETGSMHSTEDLTRRDQVLAYINRMQISREAKDALYYAAGYKESTIEKTPWRGWTAGSSGKSGKRGRAKKQAKKPRGTGPAVQAYLSRGGRTQGNNPYLPSRTATRTLPRAGETIQPRTLPRASELPDVQAYLNRGR